MKIHIENRTDLPLKIVGEVMDRWRDYSIGDTCYVGKLWSLDFECGNKQFCMEILIRKSCVSVFVIEK